MSEGATAMVLEPETGQQSPPPAHGSEKGSFQSRLDAVFGSLGTAIAAPDGAGSASAGGGGAGWTVSQVQVVRPGRQDVDSSDEEEAVQQKDFAAQQAELVELEEMRDEQGMQPTVAFCKAVDREEEYDENDEMAVGLIQHREGLEQQQLQPLQEEEEEQEGEDGGELDRHMEVLDDNVWEVRCRQQLPPPFGALPPLPPPAAAEPAAGSTPIVAGSASQQQQQGNGQQQQQGNGQQQQGGGAALLGVPMPQRRASGVGGSGGAISLKGVLKSSVAQGGTSVGDASGGSDQAGEGGGTGRPHRTKKVRFKDDKPMWVIPQRRRDGEGDADGGYMMPPAGPQDAGGQGSAARGGGQGSYGGRPRRPGRPVPDHVAHPDKYTCYTLDAPLVVGGGDQGGGQGGGAGGALERENERAAMAAIATASGAAAGQQQEEGPQGSAGVGRFEPVTGAGIAFRPVSKAKPATTDSGSGSGTAASASRPGRVSAELLSMMADLEEEGGGVGGGVEEEEGAGQAPMQTDGDGADAQPSAAFALSSAAAPLPSEAASVGATAAPVFRRADNKQRRLRTKGPD